jgi:hypothetical protein
MAYKKPNLKGFAANTIDVITSALPESKKIAEDVDIKISRGAKHVVIQEDNRIENYAPKREYDTPFFKIKFSKPAKSIFAKILKALRLSKEYAPITHESQTIYQTDNVKQKDILIKALNEGKSKYRTAKKIDIEEAKARFEAAMEQKKQPKPTSAIMNFLEIEKH